MSPRLWRADTRGQPRTLEYFEKARSGWLKRSDLEGCDAVFSLFQNFETEAVE